MSATPALKTVGPDLYEIVVPRTFWQDHMQRCDDLGDLEENTISCTARGALVHVTMDQIRDLATDASYYVECGDDMGREYFGLISSARATLKRLAKIGVTA
jgi:hypothetical protein